MADLADEDMAWLQILENDTGANDVVYGTVFSGTASGTNSAQVTRKFSNTTGYFDWL